MQPKLSLHVLVTSAACAAVLPSLPAPSFGQTGNFGPTCQELGDSITLDVELADLDGDGHLDAFAANGLAAVAPNRVWLNSGIGTFQGSGQPLAGGGNDARSVALGDLDGDDAVDALVASTTGGGEVWLNGGSGDFILSQNLTAVSGASASYALLGDVDGDADLDAVVQLANPAGAWSVFLNDGTGTFAPHPTTPAFDVTTGTGDASLGDIDGDGDLDCVTTFPFLGNGRLKTWLNDGLGNFSFASSPSTNPVVPTEVELADLDGDGDLDAVYVGGFKGLALNDGSGAYAHTALFGGSAGHGLDVGDVDGDGDADLVFATTASMSSEVWLNDGSAGFTNSEQELATASDDVALGDLDGDGDLDAFFGRGTLSNPGESGNEVWLNDEVFPPSSTTFRNGSGVNPADFSGSSEPVIGGLWNSAISLTPDVAGAAVVMTGVAWVFTAPSQGTLLGTYEVLIDPTAPDVFFEVGLGGHSVEVPCMLEFAGIPVWTQGFRIEDAAGTMIPVLLNALDLTVGV